MENFSGLLIFANAVFIGCETEYGVTAASHSAIFGMANLSFIVAFSIELVLKALSYRTEFLLGPDRYWNLFDVFLVGQMLVEQYWQSDEENVSALRVLRMMRVTRLSRIVRLLPELRTIIAALMVSLRSVIWAIFLLFIVIYVVAVSITQAVVEFVQESKERNNGKVSEEFEVVLHYFGTLGVSALTLFECITSGINWDRAYVALRDNISPWAGFALCGFVIFSVFTLLNVVTGVVVETASVYTRDEQDRIMTDAICRAFNLSADHPGREISLTEFMMSADSGEMRRYFDAVDVDVSEAKFVFDLIDADNSGSLNNKELLTALMRLRGNAKALQIALVLHDCRGIMEALHLQDIKLTRVYDQLHELRGDVQHMSP